VRCRLCQNLHLLCAAGGRWANSTPFRLPAKWPKNAAPEKDRAPADPTRGRHREQKVKRFYEGFPLSGAEAGRTSDRGIAKIELTIAKLFPRVGLHRSPPAQWDRIGVRPLPTTRRARAEAKHIKERPKLRLPLDAAVSCKRFREYEVPAGNWHAFWPNQFFWRPFLALASSLPEAMADWTLTAPAG